MLIKIKNTELSLAESMTRDSRLAHCITSVVVSQCIITSNIITIIITHS